MGDGADDVVLRRVVEDDWPLLRRVRLEMLADTPKAYLETVTDAEARSESDWRARAARGSQGVTSYALAAVMRAEPQHWVAYMACFVDGPGRAHLVSVYVAPGRRGSGLTLRMVDEVCRWAREDAQVDTVHLYVHEANARAHAFYRRYGFVETGATMPYDLDPDEQEIEMQLSLVR